MQPPVMALPPESAPWGRWVEQHQGENVTALDRRANDSNSAGRLFKSKADLLQQQVYDLRDNVDIQYTNSFGSAFVTALWGTEDTHFYGTDPNTPPFPSFMPQKDDQWYNASVILIMTPIDNNFAYPKVVVSINGQQFMTQHENFQPQYLTKPCLSTMATVQLPPGEGVRIDYAIGIANTGQVSWFSQEAWCIFSRIEAPQ